MATFSNTTALSSTNNVKMYLSKVWASHSNFIAQQGIVMTAFETFRSHSSVFALEKEAKNLNFFGFLNLIDPLLATFIETRAQTSRKYVSEQGVVMPDWSKIIQTFRSHSSVFAWEKQPKNLNFQSFFISNRPFGGYFQWKACTDSSKKCTWTRYSDPKLIKNNSNLSAAHLRFCFTKTT